MTRIRRSVFRAAEWLVAGRTAHLFVLSRADLDLLRRSGLYVNVPASLVRLPTERMRHPVGSWSEPSGEPIVVTVANFYPNKAVGMLICAFAEVQRQVRDVNLMILGDGPEREALVAQAARLPREAIHFAGHVEDPSAALLSARVFVLSSRKEGVPLALLEALALGVPSVATAVGGVAEHVRDDEAILVAPDPTKLARAIVDLLHDRHGAAELGRRGRQAAGRYVLAATLDPVIAAYRDVVVARSS